ncbi:MAG TPA: hypothetical protein VGH58_03345 [Solirubrobacterales bacterium]
MSLKRSLAVAISLIALSLCGCGGGGGDESASSATQAATTTTTSAQQARQAARQGHASAQGKDEKQRSKPKPKPPQIAVTLPPLSSAPAQGSKRPAPGVKAAKGADDSVQGYGVESSEVAREEAALALQAYLDARLEESWGRACSYLAQKLTAELEKLSSQAQSQGKQIEGCAGAMALLSQKVPPSTLREGAEIAEVLSFRVEGNVPGDPSFLLFLGPPGSTLFSMPMYMEGGEWKVGLALPSALPM